MQLIETMLGRLGSRFTLHFLPREKQMRISPLGKYYDLPWHFALGFRVGDQTRVLPFGGPDLETFPEVEMELSMNSVTFRAKDRQLGLYATFKFISPFYPKAESLCLAPFFYLDVTLDGAPHDKPVEFVAELKLVEGVAQAEDYPSLKDATFYARQLTADYTQIKTHWGPHPAPDSLSDKAYSAPILLGIHRWPEQANLSANTAQDGVSFTTKTALRSGANFGLLLATFIDQPVLEIKQVLHHFKYTQFFHDLGQVVDYALSHEKEILEKTERFDQILLDSSLGKSKTDFIAFTFQSYLPNSWWTYSRSDLAQNVQNAQSSDWFSLWEGNCTFHSTVDVEYNLAWIYLLLWPELLEKTIAEWRGYFHEDERGVWMSHDIGGLLGANQQVYPHHMEVEENCNFILLTYALWRFTGREEVRRDNLDAVTRLVRFVLDSDTSGNGFPNLGTANTVDDASPAVQFGREQTYLAVKALSACWAASRLLEGSSKFQVQSSKLEQETIPGASVTGQLSESGTQYPESGTQNPEPETRNFELLERVELINRTLDAQAWLGDHFAVTLDRRTDGLVNPWSGEPLPPGELEGWDAYSLYTANGLLYLLATDTQNGQNLPPGHYQRYRQDIIETVPRSLIEYGCTHSSSDRSHIWVSQNLHRDFIAAYLGEDLSDLTDRYWAFEQYENGQGRGGCFVDTYGGNHLRYYPRGITSLGLLYAQAGLRLDRVAGRIQFSPVRVPLRIPILTLADWDSGRIPWANFRLENGQVAFEIENEDLVAGFIVELLPHSTLPD